MEASQSQAPSHRFEHVRAYPIEALNLTVEEYRHAGTGATHLHLASDSSENVFMVALRTVPVDSTGVAHILEHTVLCGSERYPVRDPFFMMLRRSLNTFMNAFTSSDWTAYPFATQNRKDFNNLLSVYLDAVFFSRIDPLDFAQEGHRTEFEDQEDGDNKLVFKGVVFNEMKGAMSSTSSILWDRLCFELFPTNTYHFNSGGDPVNIPDLSYQQLRDFYAEHYHPSNAIFLTFGDIPAESHQLTFEAHVMSRFERSEKTIEVSLETPFSKPVTALHHYAVDASEGLAGKTHHVMGWKLGESADLVGMLEAQLLSSLLLENSASPLMKYLETTSLGSAPSALCGIEEGMREMVFCCGIEGSETEAGETFEQEVLAVLASVAETGISRERVEAALDQIELHQREISGDGMPYGLNLMLRGLGAAVHRGDPVQALDLDPVLAELRERITQPDYVGSLVKRLLLDNPHRVTVTIAPDGELSAQRRAEEQARLDTMAAAMSDAERGEVIDLAEKLRERQAVEDDPNLLPRVELSDIPDAVPEPEAMVTTDRGIQSHRYATGTNGLVYQQWVQPLPNLNPEELDRLPLLSGLMTEVGLGDTPYLDVQDRQSATVGGMGAATLTRSARGNLQDCSGWFVLSSKALSDRVGRQTDLMFETLTEARFDEADRVRELISQMRARRDQSITGSGHALAMNAATAGMNPLALRSHEQSGLEGIRRLRLLDDALADDSALEALLQELSQLHTRLQSADHRHLAIIADGDHLEGASGLAGEALARLTTTGTPDRWQPIAIREQRSEYWVANTQVNFCARAYPTVGTGHPDAPLLTVLAAVLRNGYLHRSIREQGGAYGGGASHDANIGAFRFFSYRDPRIGGTLSDFDASVRWFVDNDHEQLALEEAILGVIGSMDKPGSPAGEAKKHFHEVLFERTPEHRAAFRHAVTHATLDELKRVASTYLLDGDASTAVITSSDTAESEAALFADLGLERRELI